MSYSSKTKEEPVIIKRIQLIKRGRNKDNSEIWRENGTVEKLRKTTSSIDNLKKEDKTCTINKPTKKELITKQMRKIQKEKENEE